MVTDRKPTADTKWCVNLDDGRTCDFNKAARVGEVNGCFMEE